MKPDSRVSAHVLISKLVGELEPPAQAKGQTVEILIPSELNRSVPAVVV